MTTFMKIAPRIAPPIAVRVAVGLFILAGVVSGVLLMTVASTRQHDEPDPATAFFDGLAAAAIVIQCTAAAFLWCGSRTARAVLTGLAIWGAFLTWGQVQWLSATGIALGLAGAALTWTRQARDFLDSPKGLLTLQNRRRRYGR